MYLKLLMAFSKDLLDLRIESSTRRNDSNRISLVMQKKTQSIVCSSNIGTSAGMIYFKNAAELGF